MAIKVSVIVPVYNPGDYIEDCIASLLRQTMPADEFEAIFVDDGSTDRTPERLDRLAAEHPHLRVVHQPNSGWPGKPRNVGIDAAHGEYVFFVDNDDWLGDEALERMYAFATANNSDVVIPKMAGIRRGVPRELFRKTRPNATLANAPLIDSLTPHKMFRKKFLDANDLRFPEGKRRLEDHVFVTAAYFAAEVISVYADAVCYYHIRRDDESNAGFSEIDWHGYFANLREALDIVVANTEPGALRDRVFRRWARVEMIERLRGKRLTGTPTASRNDLLREVRAVQGEYFGPGVYEPLPPLMRIVAALAADGRMDDLLALAKWESAMGARPELVDLRWRDGRLLLDWSVTYACGDRPLEFRHEADDSGGDEGESEGRDLLEVPLGRAARSVVPDGAFDSTRRLRIDRTDLVLRSRESSAEHYVTTKTTTHRDPSPSRSGTSGGFTVRRTATSTIDPQTAAAGGPLPVGIWDVLTRTSVGGMTFTTKLGTVRADASDTVEEHRRPAIVGDPARVVLPYWTKSRVSNVALDVGQTVKRLDHDLFRERPDEPSRARVSATSGAVDLVVPTTALLQTAVPEPPDASAPVLRLSSAVAAATFELPVRVHTLDSGGDGTALVTAFVPREKLTTGTWHAALKLPGGKRFAALPIDLRMPADGEPTLGDLPAPRDTSEHGTRAGLPTRARRFARRAARSIRRRLRNRFGR